MSLDGQGSAPYPHRDGRNLARERPALLPAGPDWARGLAAAGEMGARVRDFDWSSTPLGPLGEWPSSLREAVRLCLRSRFQLAIYWGPELILLYNDAERDVLGSMHPHALGRPAAEVLADNWHVLGPMLRGVLERGEATWSVDQPLRLNRRGSVEESFFTYSYSPIPDGDSIGGVLLVTSETTERVLAERRLRTLRELAAETAQVRGADEVCARAAGALAGNPSDIPFSLLFLAEGGDTWRLCASAGVTGAPDPSRWPLREVALTGRAALVEDVALRLPPQGAGASRAALVLPIAPADKGTAAGCLVAGVNDCRRLDEAYHDFLGLVAGQIATALAGVRAQEQAAVILESITDGFVALDREWRFTYVNAEAERINGIRREDQLGKSQWELFPATRGTLLEFEWRRAVAEQAPVQFEHYYGPWGRWFHVKGYPSKDGGLSVYYHDITARKQSEAALQQAHAEMERRVAERTQELSRANALLAEQIVRRQRAQAARRELRRRLVRAQEEEHRRIARELHDDLSQQLAVLAIDAGKLEQAPGGEAARGMREQLVALSESVHSLSRQLHPSILDDLGLADAVRSECVGLGQRDGVTVRYHAQGVPCDLPRDIALCFYRVAQEALRNVAHHARCPKASVSLVAAEGELVLCVRDRGVGFDLSRRGKTGLGLESVHERAQLIHARLTVRSRPGKGTRITLRVPLERRGQP